MDRREQHIDKLNSLKYRKCFDQGILATKLKPRPQSEVMNKEASPTLEEVKQYQQQEQMTSYIVQLAYSEEFRGFVLHEGNNEIFPTRCATLSSPPPAQYPMTPAIRIKRIKCSFRFQQISGST